MSSPLAGLEPALVWERFSELTRIARPSKREEQVRQHALAWAADRGFSAATDAEGNVVVSVPATSGRDAAPVVVLQAHLDMVCERDPDSRFDPREGRIDVHVDDDWVRADGTTLGADNGIGVALALALAEDPAVAHGPLELLLTVSEEQGLDGAKALDAALVSGRLLVNLDGASDAVTVGCAGSDHTSIGLPLPYGGGAEPTLRVKLSGARGGHSGADIAAGRVNAIKALGQVLEAAFEGAPFGLVRLDGGVSRNAIPRAAEAVVAVADMNAFELAARSGLAAIVRQHAGTDDQLVLELEPAGAQQAAGPEETRRVLELLASIPTGAIAMSPDGSNGVETSICLTVARTQSGELLLSSMARSSNAAALDDLLARMEAMARQGEAVIDVRRSYPPWEPRLDSLLLRRTAAVFDRLFGSEPELLVVHGGLECAVLGQKLESVEMISIGPEIVGLHAPGEKVRISSTERCYRLLGALVDDLSR